MIGVHTTVDARGPVVQVFLRRLVLARTAVAAVVFMTLPGAAVAPFVINPVQQGPNPAAVNAVVLLLGAAFILGMLRGGFSLAAWAIAEWRDPTPVVEVRPDRFTLRRPLRNWRRRRDEDVTVAVANVARLYSLGPRDPSLTDLTPGGPDEFRVVLHSGELIRYDTSDLPLRAVELERLIREATGLDVPGEPPPGRPNEWVRSVRAMIGAD